jgi:hypothetical protein
LYPLEIAPLPLPKRNGAGAISNQTSIASFPDPALFNIEHPQK